MNITRIFCEWQHPALDGILNYLTANTQGKQLNLANSLLVFPSAKAGRRLLEKLALHANQHNLILTPPEIITIGALPEKLYQPAIAIATPLESQLSWINALINFDSTLIQKISGVLPNNYQPTSWLAIAQSIASLYIELSGNCLTFQEVGRKINQMPNAPEDLRWEILEQLFQDYLQNLHLAQLVDREVERTKAIEQGSISYSGNIILCATRELNQVTRKMLSQLTTPIISIVHAPVEQENNFDEYGCLIPALWKNKQLQIPAKQIIVCTNPEDQALAVLETLTDLQGKYHQSELVIGYTDRFALPYLESVLQEAKIPLHNPEGTSLANCRSVRLLRKLAEYLSAPRSALLYEILRFPEASNVIELALTNKGLRAPQSLIAKADKFQTEHLQALTSYPHFKISNEDLYMIEAVNILTDVLAPLKATCRPLIEWIPDLQKLIATFYPSTEMLSQELESLDAIWNSMAEIKNQLMPSVSGFESLQLLVSLCTDLTVPLERNKGEIDTLGWLELPLEDVPAIIICGMNEGNIPESINSDPFLPQGVRQHLGLIDNERRYARDAYLLQAMMHSVPFLKFLYTRFDAEGGPLLPSRLLINDAQENFLAQANQLYLATPRTRSIENEQLESYQSVTWILPPRPEAQVTNIGSLSVTAFRDYLYCPYRFYLKHILKLEPVDNWQYEMDGRLFGSLGHQILADFLVTDEAAATNSSANYQVLSQILDRLFLERFGQLPLPAAIIQREQLRQRLAEFATWQAEWRAAGWVTKHIEYSPETGATPLIVDDEAFGIYGRIDRIDYHPTLQQWTVFDYKFSERTDSPEKTHQKKEQWTDLQLPLYHYILTKNGFTENIQLGYLRLGAETTTDDILSIATWDHTDLQSALDQAINTIRLIRNQKYWPPTEKILFEDQFSSLMGTEQFFAEEQSTDE